MASPSEIGAGETGGAEVTAVLHMTSGKAASVSLGHDEAGALRRAIANGVKVISFGNGKLVVNFDNVEYVEFAERGEGYAEIGRA